MGTSGSEKEQDKSAGQDAGRSRPGLALMIPAFLGWIRALPRLFKAAALALGALAAGTTIAGFMLDWCDHPDGAPRVSIDVAASMFNPPGDDNPIDEYVCLVSLENSETVNVLGWSLSGSDGPSYRLPNFNLGPRGSVRIHSGQGENSETDLYWGRKSAVWRNEGESVRLLDANGDEGYDESYAGRQDGDATASCGKLPIPTPVPTFTMTPSPSCTPTSTPPRTATPSPTLPPSPTATSVVDCSRDQYNCSDFSTCAEVMAVFNACPGDPNRLDGDHDGTPCESLCQ